MELTHTLNLSLLKPLILGLVELIAIYLVIKFAIYFFKKDKSHSNQSQQSSNKLITNTIKTVTILLNILFIIILPISCFTVIISAMTFDSPGSAEVISNWLFFLSVMAFPAVILISVITSIVFFISKSYKTSLIIITSPIFYVIIILTPIFIFQFNLM